MEVERRPINIADMLSNAKEVFIEEDSLGMEPLPQTLVEKGEVFKTLVLETKKATVALLTLLPGAKIAEHQHVNDEEWYFDVEEKVIKCCSKGDFHSLENTTEDIKYVLSIKYK